MDEAPHQSENDEDEEEEEGGHEDRHDDPVGWAEDVAVDRHAVLDEVAGGGREEGAVFRALGTRRHHLDVLKNTALAERQSSPSVNTQRHTFVLPKNRDHP